MIIFIEGLSFLSELVRIIIILLPLYAGSEKYEQLRIGRRGGVDSK